MNHFGVADVTLESILASIERLEQRVAKLEQTLAVAATPAPAPSPVAAALRPAHGSEWNVSGVVALSGRTLMVMGGAYLLRALSEGGVLQPSAGVFAGLVYAMVWLTLCWKAPGRPSATFHGMTVVMVAYPLIWEATTRFALLSPLAGALAVASVTAAVLLTAQHRRIEPIAWFAALGGTATAVALAVATSTHIPYTAVIALIGTAALWLGYLYGWSGIRWPIALVTDVMVLLLTVRAVSPNVVPATTETLTLQFFVLALFLGSFVARTLVLGREVIPFEVAQSVAAMSVCFGGALSVLSAVNASAMPLGAVALTLGIAAYAFSFVYVEPRKHWRNLTFFTSHAVAFVLVGLVILLPVPGVVLATALLTLLCSEWARRSGRLTLSIHALVFATASAWSGGLLAAAATALGGATARGWPAIDPLMLVPLATLAAAVAWPTCDSLGTLASAGARTWRVARVSLLAWATCGVAVLILVGAFARVGGTAADPGLVAAIRTVVLTSAAAFIILRRRGTAQPECIWVAFSVLALIALKLLFEDIPRGRPATLFVALAVYGAALIALPRAARRS